MYINNNTNIYNVSQQKSTITKTFTFINKIKNFNKTTT